MTLFNVSHRASPGTVALTPGAGGTWDAGGVSGPGVIMKVSSSDYRMWYEGINTTPNPDQFYTGYATSSDGLTWTKYGSNPIFTAVGAGENSECSFTSVFFDSNDNAYRAYYHGGNNAGPRKIYYATSPDIVNGGTWTRGNSSNPVLQVGGSGAWDEQGIADAKVIQVGATDYRMWYHGWRVSDGKGQFGYATSTDGISWSKSGSNPIVPLVGSSWEDSLFCCCPLMISASEFYMWYTAINSGGLGRMGMATSSDGIAWTKYASNPVMGYLTTNGPADSMHVWLDSPTSVRLIYGSFTVSGSVGNKRNGSVVPVTPI